MLLIGGASHTGKSTLASLLAARQSWKSLSTDHLGRFPGRPWSAAEPAISQRLSDYYLSRSVDELFDEWLGYYQSMWPTIERIVERRLLSKTRVSLAFEGSAFVPEHLSRLTPDVSAIYLVSDADFLKRRIHQGSEYDSLADAGRRLVDRFIDRNWRLNELITTTAKQNRINVVNVGTESNLTLLDTVSGIVGS